MEKINKDAIERALVAGNLWAQMRNGRWWKLRRNGKTQVWKRDPARFSIPVKAGINSCARITEASVVGVGNPQDKPDFVVSSDDPNVPVEYDLATMGGKPVLEVKVWASLDSAVANGYDFADFSDAAVAEDLHEYDADLEDIAPTLLEPHVRSWRAEKAVPR